MPEAARLLRRPFYLQSPEHLLGKGSGDGKVRAANTACYSKANMIKYYFSGKRFSESRQNRSGSQTGESRFSAAGLKDRAAYEKKAASTGRGPRTIGGRVNGDEQARADQQPVYNRILSRPLRLLQYDGPVLFQLHVQQSGPEGDPESRPAPEKTRFQRMGGTS